MAQEDGDDKADSEGFGEFRNEMQKLVTDDPAYVRLGEYRLDYYWAAENQKQIVLHVYTRKGA